MRQKTMLSDYMSQEKLITPESIAQRKQFLEFSADDITILGEIHQYLERNVAVIDSFTDTFYRHMFSFPELQKLLPDEAAINRLKAVQSRYFMELTAGDYGDDYISSRLKVGYAHQRVGLEPKWYTGAYRKYLSSLQPILRDIYGNDNTKLVAAHDAILKVVFFDMDLTLDTYFHASMQKTLKLANYDVLTGLPNRNLFQDRLEQEIKKAQRNKSSLALLLIDLDQFKKVNDTLGHHAGDLLLVESAKRISRCLRETDTIARLGGDEFVIILPDISGYPYIERVAKDIILDLNKSFALGNNIVYSSASIGITVYPDDAQDIESLLKHVDQAMYVAKAEGRNRFGYFTEAMQQEVREKLALTKDLRKALVRNQFQLHFQPIVELCSGKILKAEALLRWKHPVRGMVSPSDFIPLAEETGLIHEIGEWVFKEAINSVKQWHNQFGLIIQVSVNKSPVQFEQNNKLDWLEQINGLGLPGNGITVEITEGLLLNGSANINQQLLEFRNGGVEVSIDDFGTGFSALSYLKRFDIDYLKIDRSFIKDLELDGHDKALTEAIIVMAHKLGIKTIAEGVETEGQLSLLKSFGCDFVQGFLYSPAVPAAEFVKMIEKQM
ncbi:MAG TPA: EAL domain-containing protein [Gallionella sp.]|nr:EAL domain-containing protein [Gallionella sp.]